MEARPDRRSEARQTEPSLQDAVLVVRLAAGDRAALETLVRRWEDAVLRIAYRITGNFAEAEEVRQAVFLKLIESPRCVRHPERFAGWIRRATVNTAINAAKQVRRRQHGMARLRLLESEYEDRQSSPSIQEDSARLQAALAQMKAADRALLAMKFDESLTYAEMATAMRCPASTLKYRLKKAVQRLRRLLDVSDD